MLDQEESMSFVITGVMYVVKYGGKWGTSVHEHWSSYIVYLNNNVLTCDFYIWALKDTFAFGIIKYVSLRTSLYLYITEDWKRDMITLIIDKSTSQYV